MLEEHEHLRCAIPMLDRLCRAALALEAPEKMHHLTSERSSRRTYARKLVLNILRQASLPGGGMEQGTADATYSAPHELTSLRGTQQSPMRTGRHGTRIEFSLGMH